MANRKIKKIWIWKKVYSDLRGYACFNWASWKHLGTSITRVKSNVLYQNLSIYGCDTFDSQTTSQRGSEIKIDCDGAWFNDGFRGNVLYGTNESPNAK